MKKPQIKIKEETMATNQVLQFKDEIIDGNAKYYLSDNADNTKNITLANPVVEQGTQLNKNIFDKIDNVLSYLTPSVERIGIQGEEITYTNVASKNIKENFARYDLLDKISGNVITYNSGVTATFEYTSDAQIKIDKDLTSGYTIISTYNGGVNYTTSYFQANEIRTSYASNYYNRIKISNSGTHAYKTYDFIYPCKANFEFRYYTQYGQAILQGSNDKTNWTNLYTLTNSSVETYNSTNYYRYYRFNFESLGNCEISLFYCYITSMSVIPTEYINKFTLDNNAGFTNNQRLLIETSNDIDIDGVTSNTINDVPCDTLLQPSTKYELIYNEDTNKFELGGAKPLFDITLTQAVNQVDLTGLADILKEDKLYALQIIGSHTNGGQIYFGRNYSTFLDTIKSSFLVIFNYEKETNIIREYMMTSDSGQNAYAQRSWLKENGNNYEYLRANGGNFSVGTRIIIKEIS